MKKLAQHIKDNKSSLIPLQESLRIGKDQKPEDFETLIENHN